MKIIEHLQNTLDAETLYVIPTDLHDQMLVLSDCKKRGEDVDADCRALVRVLYERRKELGCILRLKDGREIHVGVR